MRRFPSPQRVKRHFTFTVKELGRLVLRSPGTIRTWIADGLQPLDKTRPILIAGSEVHRYLGDKRGATRKRCGPGEIYCVACRDVRRPAFDEADYIPITRASGNLRALCAACGNLMHRRVALDRIDVVRGSLEVRFAKGQPHLNGMTGPSDNHDFEKEI